MLWKSWCFFWGHEKPLTVFWRQVVTRWDFHWHGGEWVWYQGWPPSPLPQLLQRWLHGYDRHGDRNQETLTQFSHRENSAQATPSPWDSIPEWLQRTLYRTGWRKLFACRVLMMGNSLFHKETHFSFRQLWLTGWHVYSNWPKIFSPLESMMSCWHSSLSNKHQSLFFNNVITNLVGKMRLVQGFAIGGVCTIRHDNQGALSPVCQQKYSWHLK